MSKSESHSPATLFGTVFFGLSIVFLGLIFVYVLLVAYSRAKETRSWDKVSAKILKVEIFESRPTPNSPVQFTPVVEYEYRYKNTNYLGTSIKRVNGPSSDRGRAEKKIKPYSKNEEVNCWVNPDNPNQVLLKHGTLAPLYTIWFPGLFVIAGLGIIVNAVKRFTASRKAE
ncbi:MAG: hypothetical protein CMO36_07185 [Verrucomicrobiaceae bacterium]|nr:hypothetical protein [Verrucomicrobiaceae bacterium]